MKKILALCLLSGLLIFNTACKEVQNTESGLSAEIWTAGGTEKFLRDYEYTERYANKVLQISACANEYEGAQIMLSGDVGTEYTVELSDLTDASGNTLSKEAFALYHQKYIEVNKIKNKNDYSAPALGYYPDAILPMETAIEYGENKLTGLNQGIWVSLKVPKEQKAGIYTGNFTVVVDGERKAVPVSVQIYDYTLTDETHVKNSFGVYADEIAWGEMDATVEMYEAYYEFFLNHRVSPQHLPGNDISGVVLEGERLELFLDYATKYAKDIRCSHYNIPYALTTAKISDGDGGTKTIPSVDFTLFANTLTEMATRSMEESVNLLEKAGTYFLFFDEYDQNGTVDRANYNLSKAKETCEAVATLLQDTLEDNGNPALREEVIESVRTLKHKVVGTLTDELTAVGVSVPTLDKYDDPVVRQLYIDRDKQNYGDDGELWVYTACSPYSPMPNYFIDEVYLLSPRLYGWMMYNYNVKGNLFWTTTLYETRKSGSQDGYQIQDYYQTSLRYPAANGDGFLVYPGAPYGIYGPVGTLRMEAIRDAYEDYELMYALEHIYSEYGVSGDMFDNVLKLLNSKLYSGVSIHLSDTIVDKFTQSRDLLCTLVSMAEKQGVVLKDFVVNKGEATLKMSAPQDVVLTVDGEALQPEMTENRVNNYTIKRILNQASNQIAILSKKADVQKTVTLDFGGRTIISSANTLKTNITFKDGTNIFAPTLSTETVDGVAEALSLYCENISTRFSMDIAVSGLQIAVDATTMKVDVYLPDAVEQDIVLVISGKGKSSSQFVKANNTTLKKGWNKIEIPVSLFKGTQYGQLEILRFVLEDSEAKPYLGEVSMAFGDIIVEG